jgi:1,4-dihydroxy-2-naphthoate polyprenyltransferase
MTEPNSRSRRHIWVNLLLYPGHTLPTAAAPVIVAAGLAVHDHVFAAVPLLVGFLASWFIHVGGVFTDNYVLIAEHPELPEHPELLAALKDGTLTLRALMLAIVACFVLAVATGPYLVAVAGIPAIALGIIGILASLGYCLSPISMTRLGIADPLFFIMFGIVAVAGAYYVQAAAALGASAGTLLMPRALPLSAFVVGLPVGALITNVLLIDDIRDRKYDALKGWHTAPVRFGLRWTRNEFVVLTIFAYVLPFGFWLALGFSPWVLLTLLTLPEAIAIARVVCTTDAFATLHPMTPRAARLSQDYAILLGVGLAVFTP